MLTLVTLLFLTITPLTTMDTNTNEKSNLEQLYKHMCRAMIDKDTAALSAMHADDFVLQHMTGMQQNKQQYINAIADGTLNYYSVEYDKIDITVEGDKATLTGCSRVEAAVFGGGRHTWRLRLRLTMQRRQGHWLITYSTASTY